MRENRSYGSEGGGTKINWSFLPLSFFDHTNPPWTPNRYDDPRQQSCR